MSKDANLEEYVLFSLSVRIANSCRLSGGNLDSCETVSGHESFGTSFRFFTITGLLPSRLRRLLVRSTQPEFIS